MKDEIKTNARRASELTKMRRHIADLKKSETESKRAEIRLSKDVALKNFLLELYAKAPALADSELYDYVLEQVVRISDSTIGFFHLVSDDQKTVFLTTWNSEALKNCTASYATHYPIDQAGNWVDCVRFRQPIVYNDFPNSPNQKGLPKGHAPVQRFMSVPVLEGDKVKIIFGVGNKSEDYDENDIVMIQVVANELQRIIGQRQAEAERERLILELREALSKIKTLSGMLPICASCKKIRDDKGYWSHIESYVKAHSDADFSHSICPDCMTKLYPEFCD